MKTPRIPTPEELQHWVQETARDQLLKTPPEIPEIPAAAEAPVASAAAPAARPARKKAPLVELVIGDLSALDGNLAKRFAQGKLPLDGVLDLHGLRKHAAEEAVFAFLAHHQARGARHLLIITGKGQVLREAMPRWLNTPALRPAILAVSVGREHRGGDGALYLLLRRHRDRTANS